MVFRRVSQKNTNRVLLTGYWLLVTLLLLGCGERVLPTATPEPTAAPTNTPAPTPTVIPMGLYVDTTDALGPISPLVYGTNYGPWLVVTVDVQDEFEVSGLTYLRFPGGRFGDTRNVQSFDIDRLIDLAATIDAEVTISVRLLGGTPERAAELVEYTNIEKGYGVKYWSIGNEPSLYIDLQKEAEWDTEFYNEQWRLYAEAMLAVDPTIELLGPNIHQISADYAARPKDPSGRDWLEEFLVANGDMVDVVTVHRYPFPISRTQPVPTLDQLRNNPQEWDSIIPALRKTVRDLTGEDKPIGIMEINSNYLDVSSLDTSPDSFYNAIWWGDVLGRLIRQEVEQVTHFALQNNRSGWGMLGRTEPRPTYYTYQLYQRFGQDLLFSESDDSHVSVLAAQRDDGATTVMLINMLDEAATKPLKIVGLDTNEASEVWRLEDGIMAENMGPMTVGDTIELPGWSMTLLVFDQ